MSMNFRSGSRSPAATSVGGTALLPTTITPEVAVITTAPTFSIGIGGFTGGSGRPVVPPETSDRSLTL